MFQGPLLRIHDLKRAAIAGAIGVWAASPKATTAAVEFSEIATDTTNPMLAPVAPEQAPDTQILRWRVSAR
jgi:hypothetical protein